MTTLGHFRPRLTSLNQVADWFLEKCEKAMRALIRAELHGDPVLMRKRDANREEYDRAIISLFQDIGFSQRMITPKQCPSNKPQPSESQTTRSSHCFRKVRDEHIQEDLEDSEEVTYLFEDVPPEIASLEKQHLIMVGYTSEGQARFVVCSINDAVLHIRVRKELFELLKRGCYEIWRRADSHLRKHKRETRAAEASAERQRKREARDRSAQSIARRESENPLGLEENTSATTAVSEPAISRSALAIQVFDTIEVLESHQHQATIIGTIVSFPLYEVWRRNMAQVCVLFATFVLALAFVGAALVLTEWESPIPNSTPSVSDKADAASDDKKESISLPSTWIGSRPIVREWSGRLATGLIVTFLVVFVELLVKYFELRKMRPIDWNSGIGLPKKTSRIS